MITDIKECAQKVICNVLEINDSNILDDQFEIKDFLDFEVDSITTLDILARLEKKFRGKDRVNSFVLT